MNYTSSPVNKTPSSTRTKSLASLIHAYLIHAPATAEKLATKLKVTDIHKIKVAVCRMVKEGRLCVSGTTLDPETKRTRYVYSGVNARLTLTSKVVLTLLTHQRMSAADIADELDWTCGGVQTTLLRLMSLPGRRVRIAAWERDENLRWVAQYGLGANQHAPKPPPFSNAENLTRFRQRRKTRTASVFDRPSV